MKVYERVGYYLGVGLANLSYAFDPDILVLGGGFSRVKHIYPNATKTLHLLYNIDPKPKIVKARFGDDAGLIGAALLAKGYWILKHQAFVIAQSPYFSSWASNHKSCVIKTTKILDFCAVKM